MTISKIDLTGEWTLAQVGGREKVPAQVPGDTHSALLAAGRIPDPYDRLNELDVQWVGRADWSYTRTFEVPKAFLAASEIILNCDSLDTVAELFINGRPAAASDNMFVRLRVAVGPLLKVGRNTIEVRFTFAEKAAAERAKALPYPVPHSTFPVQSPHRNLLRKAQCHAGWDWGPCLMVAGIVGDIYLQAVGTARIDYVYTTQRHARGRCEVDVCCELASPNGGETTLAVTLGGVKASKRLTLVPGPNTASVTLELRNPRLWWPHGYGEQPLYELTVEAAGQRVTKKLGLRTLELECRPDAHGVPMVFKVNGVNIFCKGADWIPCDALPQRQTEAVLDDLLTSAVRVGMNMLRVWGGGQYERDAFYALCDAKGLLVWHDFMFSCSLYPGDKPFLASVRAEAVHQVKRLRDFACIALWCGNNEDVGALKWYPESQANPARYLVDYDRLNEGVLGATVDALDPARVFWSSSPCGGRDDYTDCWHTDNRGDMHYWGVWHESKPFEEFYKIKPRFCSEFGFQSFPSLDTIRSYASAEEFNVSAPAIDHHQRNPGGNTKVVATMTQYFRLPEGFANFVYLSQLQQALAIKTAAEHWRRLRPYCMGVLYWQLNDNWPVCSWASLEYGGKWKLLHYLAARFYAPVMVTGIKTAAGGLEVWGVNDRLQAVAGRLKVAFVRLDGTVAAVRELPAKLPRESATLLTTMAAADLPFKPDEGFARIEFAGPGTAAANDAFLAPWKSFDLPMAEVALTVKPLAGGRFEVTAAAAKAVALFFALDAAGIRGEFDDNDVTLLPGVPRRFVFTLKGGRPSLKEFKAALSFRHLRMTYA